MATNAKHPIFHKRGQGDDRSRAEGFVVGSPEWKAAHSGPACSHRFPNGGSCMRPAGHDGKHSKI